MKDSNWLLDNCLKIFSLIKYSGKSEHFRGEFRSPDHMCSPAFLVCLPSIFLERYFQLYTWHSENLLMLSCFSIIIALLSLCLHWLPEKINFRVAFAFKWCMEVLFWGLLRLSVMCLKYWGNKLPEKKTASSKSEAESSISKFTSNRHTANRCATRDPKILAKTERNCLIAWRGLLVDVVKYRGANKSWNELNKHQIRRDGELYRQLRKSRRNSNLTKCN